MFSIKELERLKDGINDLISQNIVIVDYENTPDSLRKDTKEQLLKDRKLLIKVIKEIEKQS